ncbi:MAG: site-specific integrase [Burkholderiaceae bacterium]|nr:site-specific integrase [Burkholderiaceae bacterium]
MLTYTNNFEVYLAIDLTFGRFKCKHAERVFTYAGKPVGQINAKAWRAALKRAGIENFRRHDLRHTWASWLVQNGTPMYDLQEMGGWKSAEMVRRYAHLAPAQMAKHAAVVGNLLHDTTKAQSQK